MTCWGNLNNYTEILKCCGWKLIPELYVIGSSPMYLYPNDSKDDAVHVLICCNHGAADTTSRYLLYNVQ